MRLSSTPGRFVPYLLFLAAAAILFAVSTVASARGLRGGTGQSVREAGMHSGTHMANRDLSHNSGSNINRDREINPDRNVNRNRDVNRDVNRNINRDINVDRDIDIDVDNGWDGHPIARGVAFGTAAAVTAAAIGSIAYSLPPACAVSPYSGVTYYSCGGVWYEPRYAGTSVTYVVVNQPY